MRKLPEVQEDSILVRRWRNAVDVTPLTIAEVCLQLNWCMAGAALEISDVLSAV